MSARHHATQTWRNGDLVVIDCQVCGYRHQEPIPSGDELRELYHHEFGGTVRRGFSERKRRDAEYWNLAFERRRATYDELLAADRRRRILDIGCGEGGLLEFFAQHGWDVSGIEPSEHFADDLEAKGIRYVPKLTDDMDEDDWRTVGRSDVVNLTQVLEHVQDPGRLVRSVVEHGLLPGGILTVEVPNDFNPLQVVGHEVHDLPMWWINSLHINYFSFGSLENLLSRHGLVPERRDAQFPLELFLLFGDRYVGDAELGREIHLKRVAFEAHLAAAGALDLLRELYEGFADLGLGRTAIVHARSPIASEHEGTQ